MRAAARARTPLTGRVSRCARQKIENATLLTAVVSLYGNDLATLNPRHVTTSGNGLPIRVFLPHSFYGMFHPTRGRSEPDIIPAVPEIRIAADDVPEHRLRSG